MWARYQAPLLELSAEEAAGSVNPLVRLISEADFRARADGDSSGTVNASEFLAAMPAGAFLAADADGNGALTAAEVEASTHPLLLLFGLCQRGDLDVLLVRPLLLQLLGRALLLMQQHLELPLERGQHILHLGCYCGHPFRGHRELW